MMLFLLTACEYEWPYEVVPQDDTMAGFAECLLAAGQEQLSPDVMLGGLYVDVFSEGRLVEYDGYKLGDFPRCARAIGAVELKLPGMSKWSGECHANWETNPRANGLYQLNSLTPYLCSAEWEPGEYAGGPITEWALDSVDFELRSGTTYLLTAEGVNGEWTLPEGALDGVPEGRALFVQETNRLTVIDGVTGELVYDGEATRR